VTACDQQVASGRMSARLTVVETSQTELRRQLAELMMTSSNNEERLKSCTTTLDSLTTMVTCIMQKLESKSMASPPNYSALNQHQNPRSPHKSAVENQAQSKTTRIGASSGNPIEVVEVSYVHSEDENPPPKQSVRMTRSKDVKFKGVSGAATNSEVGMKGGRSGQVYKKKKATRGGGSKGHAFEEGNEQPVSAGGTEERGGSQGGVVEEGGGPEINTEGGSGVEGGTGSGVVVQGINGGGIMGEDGKVDSGQAASGGVGSALVG
jgi:hypothetical protein